MKREEKLEVARGSGNVFWDLGRSNADAEQFKAMLATEIIKALDREHLRLRAAHSRTGSGTLKISARPIQAIAPEAQNFREWAF